MGVRIRLASALAADLGGETLTGQAIGSRKARTFLALVAARRGALVPLDEAVDALWPGGAPTDPGANVATLASRTRRLLGPDLLDGVGGGYRLAPGGSWSVDLVVDVTDDVAIGQRIEGSHIERRIVPQRSLRGG